MKKKVLFLCTHNSARSQIAEGLLRVLYGDSYEAYSAGTQPSSVINPYAVKVMEEIGMGISGQRPKSIDEFRGVNFDYIVTVCDHVRETCPFFPGSKALHESFEDPSAFSGTEDEMLAFFRRLRDEIKGWIEKTFSEKTAEK